MPGTRYVIARYEEDISWTKGLPEGEVVVYCKGEKREGGEHTWMYLPNVGREGHTYLWFLTSNYRDLPEVVVFSQGDPRAHIPSGVEPADHLMRLAEEARRDGVAGFCKTAFNLDFNIWQAQELRDRYGVADPDRIVFEDWFKRVFGADYPDPKKSGCHVAYGGIFAMRRDVLLSRDRGFYKALMEMLGMETNPLEGHFLERSWYYIPLRRAAEVQYYAICLKGNTEREKAVQGIKRHLPALRVEDAVDAKGFTHESLAGLIKAGYIQRRGGKYVDGMDRPFQLGAIGCAMSHRQVLEHVLNQEKKYAIVFEDDVRILPGFHWKLERIIKRIEDYRITFDFLNLSVMEHQRKLFSGYNFMAIVKSPPGLCGTQCYMVCKDTVINVLINLQKFSDPIDEQLSRAIEIRYANLVGERLVRGTETVSAIQTEGKKIIEATD